MCNQFIPTSGCLETLNKVGRARSSLSADEEDVEKLLKSTTDLVQLVSEQCSHLSDSVSDEEQLSSLLTASIHHNKDELQVSHQNMEVSGLTTLVESPSVG